MLNDVFFRQIIINLAPSHHVYKENIRQLDTLTDLIRMIKLVQHGLLTKMEEDAPVDEIDDIDRVLTHVYDTLVDVLEKNKHVGKVFDSDFEQICNDFQAEVRAIDPNLLPSPTKEQSRLTQYIPHFLYRTSQMIGSKLMHALAEGTQYETLKKEKRSKRIPRLVLVIAVWCIAIFGTLISVGILTRDYIQAQQNLTIKIDRSKTMPMRLPAITVCSSLRDIPTFANFPTKRYPGFPLFAVTSYHRGNRSENLPPMHKRYPDTRPDVPGSPVESVIVSRNKEGCLREGFDSERDANVVNDITGNSNLDDLSTSGTPCFYCFRIGIKQEEHITKMAVGHSLATAPAVSIRLSRSRMLDLCYSKYARAIPLLHEAFSSQLFKYAAELEKGGILDFNGTDYGVLRHHNAPYFFSRAKANFVDFYCNVYFFSGFFYPRLSDTDIKYRYSNRTALWYRAGKGPFFDPYIYDRNDKTAMAGPNERALKMDAYVFCGIRLYGEDASLVVDRSKRVSPETEFDALSRTNHRMVYMFKQLLVNGQAKYETPNKIHSSYSTRSIRQLVVDDYDIGFDFWLFEVERIYQYSTMTFSELVTDIFEYVGMFTGVCFFTLVIAPANRKYKESVDKESENESDTNEKND